MGISIDFFPLLDADGPTQMAADEALLERAAAGRAGLRCYTWSAPTLSLGYFQRAADRLTDPKLAGLPYVRRATGGGAIVHHHELTYGLALPVGVFRRGGGNWVCRMHDVIGSALARFGVAAEAVGCGDERGAGAFLCFEHQTAGDLVIGGAKVVGSAQRKRAGAVLQHGSILLAASPAAPHLPGVRERTGVTIAPAALAEAVATAFTDIVGWRLVAREWSLGPRAAELAADRYRQAAWNDRR
jgi:lipoate-protein ligase A